MRLPFKSHYDTDSARASMGIAAGAALGSALFPGVLFIQLCMLSPQPVGLGMSVGLCVLLPIGFFCWILGLVMCGGPPWFVLHQLGLRCWPWAAGAGAAVATLLTFLMEQWSPSPVVAGAALCGGAVAATVWRVSYRRNPLAAPEGASRASPLAM